MYNTDTEDKTFGESSHSSAFGSSYLHPAEMEGEMKERRKIQFSVPSAVPTQLDPKQVEMIRRRRPTPATLFRLTDHPSPEEENPSHQVAVCENGVLKVKHVSTAMYQPPSLTAVQKMVEAHLQSSETTNDTPSSSDNEEVSPDTDKDNTRLDQLDHPLASEVTVENMGSTLMHDVPGEEDEETAHVEVDNSADKKADEADPPDDTRSDQSDHTSTSEITDEDTVSCLLHAVLVEDNEGTDKSSKVVDKKTDSTYNSESKENGEDKLT